MNFCKIKSHCIKFFPDKQAKTAKQRCKFWVRLLSKCSAIICQVLQWMLHSLMLCGVLINLSCAEMQVLLSNSKQMEGVESEVQDLNYSEIDCKSFLFAIFVNEVNFLNFIKLRLKFKFLLIFKFKNNLKFLNFDF